MILIGGSGSTGSSLLQAILNRHPSILAGQETCLFIYPHLYRRWNRYKHYLIARGVLGVKSTGWSIRNGADLLHQDYGWEKKALEAVIRQSKTFSEFVNLFFQKALEKKGARIWVEKTPQNAYSFRTFLQGFPKGKVIHTLRNPYDTMASLVARGFDVYQAAGYYVYHAAAAASVKDDRRYFEIRYEKLVNYPQETLRSLFEFLDVEFDPRMLQPRKEELAAPLKLEGWNHSERGFIEITSVGRFHQLPQGQQQQIMAALCSFRISDSHLQKHNILWADCRSLCQQLGYEFIETNPAAFLHGFRKSRFGDMLRRTLRFHPTNFLCYPGKISPLYK